MFGIDDAAFMGAAAIGGASSLLGGALSSITGSSAQRREYERQKEFAMNGIRWKVADAKAAGIHPLYALGAQTASYSPQATNGTDYGLSEMGQSIKGAMQAKQTAEERAFQRKVDEYNLGVKEIEDMYKLENMKLQNQALRQNMFFAEQQFLDSSQAVIDQRNESIPPLPTTQPIQANPYVKEVRDGNGNVVGVGLTKEGQELRRDPLTHAILNGYYYFTRPIGGAVGNYSRWDLMKANMRNRWKYNRPSTWEPYRERH